MSNAQQTEVATIKPKKDGVEVVNVYSRLAHARDLFHAMVASGEVKKSGLNEYSNYTYFELEDIVPPGLKCMHDAGLCVIPVSSDGVRAFMGVVEIDTGDKLEFSIPFSSAKLKACHEVQNLGAVMSYSRRYLWINLLEVVEQDLAEKIEPAEKHSPKDPATEKQMDALRDAYKTGSLSDEAAKTLKSASDSGKSITIEQASALIAGLSLDTEARIKNQGAKK